MLSEPVIDRQVAWQPTVAFLGVLERHSVGPFPTKGLNESLSLPVGARGIRAGADMFEAQGPGGLGNAA